MLSPLLFLVCGFILLGVGAEMLVSGSSKLALKLGIPPLIVGLTIVAFGTSAPELAVSLEAASNGRSALALGNVIGSNIANIGLILGITALIYPIPVEEKLFKHQIPLMIAASLLLWLLLIDGDLDFTDGIILVTGLLVFLIMSYRTSSNEKNESAEKSELEQALAEAQTASALQSNLLNILLIVCGLALLIGGSHVFVENAITLAHLFGVSEAIIGLTVVAIGTSIPELATSVIAAIRKQPALAIGNVIGSNLFNILGILGATSLISTISAAQFSAIDMLIMVGFACAVLPFAWSNLILSRIEGVLLLGGYCGYLVYII